MTRYSNLTQGERLPGMLVTLDGPGGVGKTTTQRELVDALAELSIPVHPTCQPSRTDLGELVRHGTQTYHGMALACLVAGDRHHQLATEILPALHAGKVVVCDRYVPSSLVLQGIDGIAADTVWTLNAGAYVPDLAVILTARPEVIANRLHRRGSHSRFELVPNGSHQEVTGYHAALADLSDHGWPTLAMDCTTTEPGTIVATLSTRINDLFTQRSAACPS